MNILGVQIIAVLFAIFMLYVAFLHWKRKDINGKEIFFWGVLWLGFIVITLFPDILQNITEKLFFTRVMDFLMVIAFMILAFLGFQNHVSNRKMERKIEELVRKEALKDAKKKK
jgi:hypothetical protein